MRRKECPLDSVLSTIQFGFIIHPTKRQRYADSPDARERAFSAAAGVGMLMHGEAMITGKIDGNKWAAKSILGDRKMDKFHRK